MKTLLIFDGHNSAWRLMKKLPMLTANKEPIQVVYGMLRLIRSALEQFEADMAIICWDSGRSATRLDLFPGYKAHRDHDSTEEKEEENKRLISQIKILKEMLHKLNIRQLSYPNSEADDLIGIACCHLTDMKKIVISSDTDMFQLIDEDTSVWSPIKFTHFTKENFKKEIGLSPQQHLEVKALAGDRSDGIPGVAEGFGIITATELIKQYGNIENLFKSSVEKSVSKKGNRYALLYGEGVRENAYRNLHLMDLRIIADESKNAEEIRKLLDKNLGKKIKLDKMEVRTYFKEKKFESILNDFVRWIAPFENLD